jgi:DNA (cytosine-5)-methyltransferase 1
VKFGSVCSGIEAASTAWEPLGWAASWFAEIEPFPCAVLAHHWPDTPNLGDFTAIRHKIASGDLEAPDVLVGGTPCQAFSVAGLRKSLDDQRGQLTIQFVGLADAIDDRRRDLGLLPAIIVWENVPGVLNTPDNAFGCFLAAVAGNDAPLVPPGGRWTDAGFVRGPRRSLAWRVQDAQYHGLAQRRRRVFLVASAGEGFRPEQVLFEFDGVRRDSPPLREPREGASPNASEGTGSVHSHWEGGAHPTLNRGGLGGVGVSNQEVFSQRGGMLVPGIAGTLDKGIPGRGVGNFAGYTDNLVAEAIPIKCSGAEGANGAGIGSIGDPCPTLDTTGAQGIGYAPATSPALGARDYKGTPGSSVTASGPTVAVGVAFKASPCGAVLDSSTAPTLLRDAHGGGANQTYGVRQAMQVRRLTPEECEKLQGFPVGHTRIPWRGKAHEDCPDGPRYKALGNSMAVPCMAWIAKRIIRHLAGDI